MKFDNIKYLLLGAVISVAGMTTTAEAKKPLDHEAFDGWKRVYNHTLSRDGKWGAYSINPQEGDGVLVFYTIDGKKKINIERGYSPTITADSRYAAALIKPLYADTRKAKIDKKKDFDLPQDSLAIVDLRTGNIEKIANVISYKIAKNGSEWLAYQSCDTSYIKPTRLKEKETGRPLVVRDLRNRSTKVVNYVKHYVFNEAGDRLAITSAKSKSDSLSSNTVGMILLPDTSYVIVDHDKAFYGKPVFDKAGTRMAFTWSADTLDTGTKDCSVSLVDISNHMRSPRVYRPEYKTSEGILLPNQYTEPQFSANSRRLIVGVAPVIAPDDTTLVDFEEPTLDIWVYDKPMTPPQERLRLSKLRERTMPVVINLADDHSQLITDVKLADVSGSDEWNGEWALVADPMRCVVSQQWDYFAPIDLSIVNVNNGEKVEIGVATDSDPAEMSPAGKYVIWYKDRTWWVYDIAARQLRDVSKSVNAELWDRDDDHPCPNPAFGLAGWTADDKTVLLYDKYDIWEVDPTGVKEATCLTAGEGKARNIKIRYRKTDPNQRFISKGDVMLYDLFDYTNKYYGLATQRYGYQQKPEIGVLNGYYYSTVKKALDAPVYSWLRGNFEVIPELWACNGVKFDKAVRLTDVNEQKKEYSWGTAQLVKWNAYDGKESEGVLYLPEDFDPNKKYPMLAVFYETGSEDLYYHYTMEPSWSWVNYPFYVSRGYVIFVPDIHYTPGIPGESCYNYVCSGVEEMCRRYPQIDKDRIGIDGQSWGGYQTAYLVTRTNMFAAAGSGAPVSNMTSAFGGIRWESGDSRQGQYELGQSRVGRNLWDGTELYIANSPVFHANRVETPLLIMHNDADGAVPWYQGIEMFMALRRLGKPVWMLQYNDEAHNLRQRRNRRDITVRLQQFFDHYLKGDPMPQWMKEGIPMLRKGQEKGYQLTGSDK